MVEFSNIKIPLIFGIVFGFFIGIHIASNWNENESTWSKTADGFSIGGVFLATYIAIWAYRSEARRSTQEQEKLKHEQEENKYYKINLKENLSIIESYVNYCFPKKYWEKDEAEREKLESHIKTKIKGSMPYVFQVCNDTQILNINPCAPPKIKDDVGLIIQKSRKTFVVNHIATEVYSLAILAEGLLENINKLLSNDYFKEEKTTLFHSKPKPTSITYTGKKYYATRQRLAYHPPDKQFKSWTDE